MPRYAIINANNKVFNVIKWDGKTPWQPRKGFTAVLSATANVGQYYDPQTGEFSDKPSSKGS